MKTYATEDAVCEAIASTQEGHISRDQALDSGLAHRAIDLRLSSGRWRAVLPNVYLMRPAPVSWSGRLHAARLWAGPQSVVSHRSAAALHRLTGFRQGPVEISVPKRLWRVDGVTVHTFKPDDKPPAQWIDDLRVTRVNRTLYDLAAKEPMARLQPAFDDAYRRDLFGLPQMANELLLRGRRGKAGTVKIRRLVAERDSDYALTESELEGRMLDLLKPLGIEDLQVQRHISIGSELIARVDLACPSRMIIIEVDGWRFHKLKEDLRRDNARERRLTLAGWRVLRFVWDDVIKTPDVVVRDVLHALRASDVRSV
jgi:very-short-patch-repair endonuclease